MTWRSWRRWRKRAPTLAVATLIWHALAAPAGAEPTLSAVPHQVRKPAAEPISSVKFLEDTTWWITLDAHRDATTLDSLEYQAKFIDGPDTRMRAGTIELVGNDREGFSGRIDVVCQTRPDYTRPVRVRLRLRDTNGGTSEWAEVQFPVREGDAVFLSEPEDAPHVTTDPEPEGERQYETLGTVEVEVDSETTIARVREMLQEKAKARGGDAVVGFRLASSSADRNTFAAEVVRYVVPTAAPMAPTAVPSKTSAARVIGEIVMPHGRQ